MPPWPTSSNTSKLANRAASSSTVGATNGWPAPGAVSVRKPTPSTHRGHALPVIVEPHLGQNFACFWVIVASPVRGHALLTGPPEKVTAENRAAYVAPNRC